MSIEQLSFWQEAQERDVQSARKGKKQQTPSIDREILKQKALIIWFHKGQGIIPLSRADALYTIVMTSVPTDRKAVARVSGHYELLKLTDQEIAYLYEYAYQQLIDEPIRGITEEHAVPLRLTIYEEDHDPTEEDHSRPKSKKKVSVKELETQLVLLEMQLELARPKWMEKLIKDDRFTNDRIRSLEYYLRESELYLKRQHRRIEELEGHSIDWCAFPPPKVTCRHCGKREWEWKGYGYQCRSCWVLSTEIENTCVTLREENQQLRERIAELEKG